MTTIPYWIITVVSSLIGTASSIRGEEILLHTGPPISTPAATPITPFPERGSPKLINFQREFFIDRNVLASLPWASAEHENVPLSAIEAINLAQKNVFPAGSLHSFKVTELKLLKGPMTEKRHVDYYLVSMLSNGSEEHRIVLVNGDVIASKLREIKD